MKIVDFTMAHMEEAAALALSNYQDERAAIPVLPQIDCLPSLKQFAENGLGTVAYENDRMIGFLGCFRPIERAFMTTAKGTFSPVHAHAAVKEGRRKIYQYLYQTAAGKWARQGISSHSIALYAHDNVGIEAFFTYGFGQRCADAIRPMEEVRAVAVNNYEFAELSKMEVGKVADLRKKLAAHVGASPCFMKQEEDEVEAWVRKKEDEDTRIFVAAKAGAVIAYLEIADEGETFIAAAPGVQNICGAYCCPEHRGSGVYLNLMNYVIRTLKQEGYPLLGVDFESINPTAYGFWLKYFTAYTTGVVRRIDESALTP